MKELDKEQRVQEDQYEYPYHYIPSMEEGGISQVRYWSWGFRYLGGLKLVMEEVAESGFKSLIDVGCGDGRFLAELNSSHPRKRLLGVDYSRRAIELAKVMSPNVEYECRNILDEDISEDFDVATLVEVLEHILPEELDSFLEATCRLLEEDAMLVATVPHVNKPVSDKHYQHFDRSKLEELLDPHFDHLRFIHFDDVKSTLLEYMQSWIGGDGNHFVVTNKRIMSLFWTVYKSRYLYTTEDRCGRIAVVAKT